MMVMLTKVYEADGGNAFKADDLSLGDPGCNRCLVVIMIIAQRKDDPSIFTNPNRKITMLLTGVNESQELY